MTITVSLHRPGLGVSEDPAMRRAPAAAAPTLEKIVPPIGALSMRQPAAQRSPATPTRVHQSGGQPTSSRPAHGRALDRAPPNQKGAPAVT
jgi:hypothetical protein